MNTARHGEEGWYSPGSGLAIYRIVVGIMWLDLCLQKAPWVFDKEGNRYGWLYGWIWTEINNPTFQWYADFLQYFFLPNLAVMGMIVFLQELAIALSLITGTFVPLVGGLLGLLMQINLLIGNYSVPGEWFWTYPLLIVSHLAFTLDRAGRVLGIDGVLARRVEKDTEHSGLIGRLLAYAV